MGETLHSTGMNIEHMKFHVFRDFLFFGESLVPLISEVIFWHQMYLNKKKVQLKAHFCCIYSLTHLCNYTTNLCFDQISEHF